MEAEGFRLGNIGSYKEVDDFYPIGLAAILGVNMGVAGARLGNIGGLSLNTYFDAFGLEGILANTALIVIIMQIARLAYTTWYAEKPWSPFIFVCILIVVQFVHDLIFYYGAINVLPSGRNEMIDVLKDYAKENGGPAMGGHAFLLIFIATMAMIFKEVSALTRIMMVTAMFYILPYLITFMKPKKVVAAPAPPPPPAEKKEEKLTARDMYQDMNWR